MNFKIFSMAFLMGVSGTPLVAQPKPPLPVRCTNASDTLCNSAAAVYNAITGPNPVPATTTLARDIANLQRFIENPNIPGTSLQTALSLEKTSCTHPSVQCVDLVYGVTLISSYLPYYSKKLPSSTIINNLVETQGNMSQLNSYSPQFYNLFYAFNQLDSAISAFPLAAAPSKVNKPLSAVNAPVAPAKGAAPAKK